MADSRGSVMSSFSSGSHSGPHPYRTFAIRRLYPVAAFVGGFLWDALTLGLRVRTSDFWRLSLFLVGAALLLYWLAWRRQRFLHPPEAGGTPRHRLAQIRWLAPYLLLQFFFGGLFSALFILYVKSAGHLPAWLAAGFLALLLIANEFWRDRYGRRFTLNWCLFALCAVLLLNFILPYAAGSLDRRWFYVAMALGLALTLLLYRLAPGSPGRIRPVWGVAAALLFAWHLDMVAPVPLVHKACAVGQDFSLEESGKDGVRYRLAVEPAPAWAFWKSQSDILHVPAQGRLYAISAVYAPRGVSAALEHRWLYRGARGWQLVRRIPFTVQGGRDQGFRGYSYLNAPEAGRWRLIVSTQEGQTITRFDFEVRPGSPLDSELRRY